jgi:hypothetical protein
MCVAVLALGDPALAARYDSWRAAQTQSVAPAPVDDDGGVGK